MSDNVTFEWDFTQLENDLLQMGKNLEKAQKKATMKGAKILSAKLSENINRSKCKHHGNYKHMKDNIKISTLKEDEKLNNYRGVGFGKLQFKAKWLEYGVESYDYPAQHILSKTVIETQEEVHNVINQEIKKELGL